MAHARNWCFTIFLIEGDEDGSLSLTNFPWPDLRYGLYQLERCPDTGRLHLQGYAQFTKRFRLSGLKKLHPSAHWACARGTPAENEAYCTKLESRVDGTGPVRFGELEQTSSQGRSCDLQEAVLRIRSVPGYTEEQFGLDFPASWARHQDLFTRVKLLGSGNKRRDTHLVVYIGPTGVGKSTRIFEQFPDAYWKPPGKWWCGYQGQETVVFDDFDGSWFSCSDFLRILNPFPTYIEAKGHSYKLVSERFCISTNIEPRDWYRKHFEEHPAHLAAVIRRINEVVTWNGVEWVSMSGEHYFAPPVLVPYGGIMQVEIPPLPFESLPLLE